MNTTKQEYMPTVPYFTASRSDRQDRKPCGCKPTAPAATLLRSDDGESYLAVQQEPKQEFAAPVPYYTAVQGAPRAVRNTAAPKWPESFADRFELVQAAANELRRAGAIR